jgi:hypothetical protein
MIAGPAAGPGGPVRCRSEPRKDLRPKILSPDREPDPELNSSRKKKLDRNVLRVLSHTSTQPTLDREACGGEMDRWRDGEMERWRTERWRDGEMENGEMERWGDGDMQWFLRREVR